MNIERQWSELATYLRSKEKSLIVDLRNAVLSPTWKSTVEVIAPQLALMHAILTKVEQLERGERPARLTPSQEES